MQRDKKSFGQMFLEFNQKKSELQVPPSSTLTEKEFAKLRKDRELRSKSANYRLLGEDSKADALEKEILNIQDDVVAIKEKLSKAPTGQQEIDKTIADTPDSKLHKKALKVQKAGLLEYKKVLREIEESEAERVEFHSAVAKNARQRGILERKKYEIYLKLKEVEKALPAEEHKATRPERAPEWAHFLPDEDVVGRAYGQRPYLIQGRY